MLFWIFLFVVNLSLPLIIFLIGKVFSKGAPTDINKLFGYRTTMSMKNKDTWEFAHKACGRIWKKLGIVLFILTIIVMPIGLMKVNDKDFVGMISLILCTIQIISMIASVYFIEKELKENFDEEGNKRTILS